MIPLPLWTPDCGGCQAGTCPCTGRSVPKGTTSSTADRLATDYGNLWINKLFEVRDLDVLPVCKATPNAIFLKSSFLKSSATRSPPIIMSIFSLFRWHLCGTTFHLIKLWWTPLKRRFAVNCATIFLVARWTIHSFHLFPQANKLTVNIRCILFDRWTLIVALCAGNKCHLFILRE